MAAEKQNNKTIDFLKKIENENVINVREILSNHVTRLLLGAGFDFDSENKKIVDFWNSFIKLNKFSQFLNTIVQIGSLKGRAIVSINKLNNMPVLSIAKTNYLSKVSKIYVEEKTAIIYTQPIKDDRNLTIREVWDDHKVVRSVEGNQITLDEINTKLPPEEKIEKVWIHNLGFLPIVEFVNKSLDPVFANFHSTSSQNEYDTLSDDFNVRNLGEMINATLRTKAWESSMNFTRIIGLFDSTQIDKIKREEGGILSYMMDKTVFNIAKYGEKGEGPNISVVEVNPNLPIYNDSIKRDFEFYFEGAGYSTPDQAVMDSATQVLYSKSRDVETTNQKRDLYTTKLLELIDKCLICAGLSKEMPNGEEEREYSFSIKNNLQVSETEKLANLQMKLQMGLISKVDSIAELYNIKAEEAEQKLKAIQEEQAEEMDMMAEKQKNLAMLMGQPNIPQPGGEIKPAAPEQPIKEEAEKSKPVKGKKENENS